MSRDDPTHRPTGWSDPARKYRPFAPIQIADRAWPSRVIEAPPIWCSVDLRDGNQALVEPMDCERKLCMFQELVRIGFREIEVGFPSASQTEFDFVRLLIEEGWVPADVTIQVLTPAREPLIRRTLEAIAGAPRVIVHLYNSTSTVQRRVVFGLDRAGIVDIAVSGAKLIRELSEELPETEVVLEYSPESFTGTELDFAVEICEAVMEVWKPTPETRMILNLPATVEMATPNVYADQIEWFGRHVRDRDHFVLSVHPHNDRGTAVAGAELAQMAGAERVEGTLFGNGERTGNVDVATLALNLLSQGIDPGLDFSDIDRVVRVAEHCNRLPVHPRHAYAGELVFTAFSGSHQDAIKKGLDARRREGNPHWEVPYLPIDPSDVGRSYEPVIRINSQSGKGGVAYLLARDRGFVLPRRLQIEFSQVVQRMAEQTGEELTPDRIGRLFEDEYLSGRGRFALIDHDVTRHGKDVTIAADVLKNGRPMQVHGRGNGPIAAFVDALRRSFDLGLSVGDYHEHALGGGADATAVAYVEILDEAGESFHGVGRDEDIVTASLRAVLSAVNRSCR